jgi:hypothetical protein
MTDDLKLRDWLTRYLAGEISLSEFDEWFAPTAWSTERVASPDAQTLAHAIGLRLAEYSSGYWSEDELRSQLRPLVERYVVSFGRLPRTASASVPTTI